MKSISGGGRKSAKSSSEKLTHIIWVAPKPSKKSDKKIKYRWTAFVSPIWMNGQCKRRIYWLLLISKWKFHSLLNNAWIYKSARVNFANILLAALTQMRKRHWWLDCIFVLLGSALIKAVNKHVGEINPFCLFSLLPYLKSEMLSWFILAFLASGHTHELYKHIINIHCKWWSTRIH